MRTVTQGDEAFVPQPLHDSETGLFNRRGLQQHLDQLTTSGELRAFALIAFHTQGLVELADAFGPESAEQLVRQLAARLLLAGPAERCARLGEEELAVVVPGGDLAEASHLAGKATLLLEQPVFVEGNPLEVLVHAGIARFPQQGDGATVLRRAGLAAAKARELGEDVHVYALEDHQYGGSVVRVSSELRRAMDHGDLALQYQPKVSMRSGEVTGAEAFTRWMHPDKGNIPPNRFIPVAEQSRLIRRVSHWAMEAAMRQARAWRDAGRMLPIAVNLSMRDLQDPQLAAGLEQMLAREGLTGRELMVEITETMLMTNPSQTLETLRQISELGVGTSIDDFGTGYSSLSYLAKLPVTEVKIDQSFIQHMFGKSGDRVIVRSVIELGHALGVQVVAEGVETRRAWDTLLELGCETAQGFYIAPPMPPDELGRWLGARAA
ncbi:MAG TPA: bifunctional diguanylate cyclase/phosphodiesterase [Chloroflexota bacterium]|nr:bifunctional diguanylate cyclase/phosphodiesterase [Chloroflexota bacterium]